MELPRIRGAVEIKKSLLEGTILETGREFQKYDLLAPFFGSKIICLGLNYRSHVRENKTKNPENPALFSKATSAVIADNECVLKPEITKQLDSLLSWSQRKQTT